MQKTVETALPSASVHSLFLSYLTVSLTINQEELVEEDKSKRGQHTWVYNKTFRCEVRAF